jgi:hypothetical protein
LNPVASFVPPFSGPFPASSEHETTFALRALDGDDGKACCLETTTHMTSSPDTANRAGRLPFLPDTNALALSANSRGTQPASDKNRLAVDVSR